MANEAEDQRAPYEHPGGRDYRVRDDHDSEPQDVRDYVGVTDEYKTYATVASAPSLTDTEHFLQTNQYDHLEGNAEEQADEEEEEETERKPAKKSTAGKAEADVQSADQPPASDVNLPPLG